MGHTEDFDILNQAIHRARQIFSLQQMRSSYIGLAHFPHGACVDSSVILGMKLRDLGFIDLQLVRGRIESANHKSHAWLENEHWLIDISADQFIDHHTYILYRKFSQITIHLNYAVEHRDDIKLIPDLVKPWMIFQELWDQFK